MDAIETRSLAQLAQLLQAGGFEGELRIGRKFGQALVAEIAALSPQWQPIELAPKDGDILAWDGDDIRVTHWHTRPSGAGGWYEQVDQYEVFFWGPTHWQPLPASPEVE